MSLVTLQRENAVYHINTAKVSVTYDFDGKTYQIQLASGKSLNITESEYNMFVGENNESSEE